MPYFILIALFLSACASLYSPDIKVQISDIQPLGGTLMEQRFKIKLNIMNRSQQALEIHGISFDIALNERDFASGVSDQSLTIPPLSTADLELEASTTLFSWIKQIQNWSEQRQFFDYQISGKLYGSHTFHFSESGQIGL